MSEQLRSRPSRTEFTFFPHENGINEQERLSRASWLEIAGYCMDQPHMTSQFLHELWRTNRDEDIYHMSQRLGANRMLLLLGSRATAMIVLTTVHGESDKTNKAFLQDTLTAITKAGTGVRFSDTLDIRATNLIERTAQNFIIEAQGHFA